MLNESRPEPSAGRGALAMVGYCSHQLSVQLPYLSVLNGSPGTCQNVGMLRTEVVLTPQSKSETVCDAAGVSMNSKVSSEVLPLILRNFSEFWKDDKKTWCFRRTTSRAKIERCSPLSESDQLLRDQGELRSPSFTPETSTPHDNELGRGGKQLAQGP